MSDLSVKIVFGPVVLITNNDGTGQIVHAEDLELPSEDLQLALAAARECGLWEVASFAHIEGQVVTCIQRGREGVTYNEGVLEA